MVDVVGGGFTSKRGTFGTVAKLDSMLCVTYGKTPDICYTGGSSGAIYVWVGLTLSKTIKAHEGPCFATHSLEKVGLGPLQATEASNMNILLINHVSLVCKKKIDCQGHVYCY